MGDEGLVARVLLWAERRRRTLNPAVLQTILRARDHRHGGVGMWPPGSVVDLLLVRWPATGENLPEREVMAATLDTLWRFLRATGAMGHASADVKALTREFRQAAVLTWLPMAPPAPVPGTVDLQDRLDREAEVWNATANRERSWDREDEPSGSFSPPGGPGSGSTDPAWYAPSSPSKCAQVVREAEFVRHCLAIAEWAGGGVEVSDEGYSVDSAEDDGLACLTIAPDLVWITCVRAGLVRVDGHRAWSEVDTLATDEEWADLGLQLVVNLLICMEDRDAVLYAITGLFSPGFGGWAREVLVECWWLSTANKQGQRAAAPDPDASQDAARGALELLAFVGMLGVIGEHEYVPTALGHDVALAVLHLGLQGMFLEAR